MGVKAGKVVVHRCHGNLCALTLEAQVHLLCSGVIGGGVDEVKNDLSVLVHLRSSVLSLFELEQFQFYALNDICQVAFKLISLSLIDWPVSPRDTGQMVAG